MAVGEWHQLNEYRFRETLHGSLVDRICAGCDFPIYATPEAVDPLCSGCGRQRYGVPPAAMRRNAKT